MIRENRSRVARATVSNAAWKREPFAEQAGRAPRLRAVRERPVGERPSLLLQRGRLLWLYLYIAPSACPSCENAIYRPRNFSAALDLQSLGLEWRQFRPR